MHRFCACIEIKDHKHGKTGTRPRNHFSEYMLFDPDASIQRCVDMHVAQLPDGNLQQMQHEMQTMLGDLQSPACPMQLVGFCVSLCNG